LPSKISLLDIEKLSTDLDNTIQQERETNSFTITATKEFVKLKLEESYKQEKSKICSRPINVPDNLGFIQNFGNIWNQYGMSESKLASLLEESKIKISKLSVESVLESLRINYVSGFIAASEYILDLPITMVPKPYSKRQKII